MTTKARMSSLQSTSKKPRKPPRGKTLLFRLRTTDSPNGISARTLKQLARVFGVPETQVIHQALRKLASEFIPAYEADDGPVSDHVFKALKDREPQDRYTSIVSSLFAK
jgi:hypothetical protein